MGEPSLPKDSEVNVEQIAGLPELLKQLQGYVETHCIGYMTNIRDHLDMSGIDMDSAEVKLNGEATPFGGFYSAFGVAAKADSAYKTVNKTLQELAKHLGMMVEPTQKIAQNYRNAEERNRAGMADIKKLLDEGKYTPVDPVSAYNYNESTAAAQDTKTTGQSITVIAPGPSGTSGTSVPGGNEV